MKRRGLIIGIVIVTGVLLVLLSQRGREPRVRGAVERLAAPDFTLLDLSGKAVSLSDLRGKTVFLHFWATWCKECKKELPSIQALYNRKRSDPDIVFLSVVYRDDPARAAAYLKDNGYDVPFYTDPEGRAARSYGVTGVPETYIIGPDGILLKKIIGPGEWGGL